MKQVLQLEFYLIPFFKKSQFLQGLRWNKYRSRGQVEIVLSQFSLQPKIALGQPRHGQIVHLWMTTEEQVERHISQVSAWRPLERFEARSARPMFWVEIGDMRPEQPDQRYWLTIQRFLPFIFSLLPFFIAFLLLLFVFLILPFEKKMFTGYFHSPLN